MSQVSHSSHIGNSFAFSCLYYIAVVGKILFRESVLKLNQNLEKITTSIVSVLLVC